MKKLLFFLSICIGNFCHAQTDNIEDLVSGLERVGYSTDNSAIYTIDLMKTIHKCDSLFVEFDKWNDTTYTKKAIISLDGKHGLIEIYITSQPLSSQTEKVVCEYATYVDTVGYVHQLFLDNPQDKLVLKQLTSFLQKTEPTKQGLFDSPPGKLGVFFLICNLCGIVYQFFSFIYMIFLMEKILGVDLDEVLAETLDGVLRFHDNKLKGKPIQRSDVSTCYLRDLPDYGVSFDEGIQYFVDVLGGEAALQINPVKGAKEKLQTLKQNGWQIVIVTARVEVHQKYTFPRLKEHFDGLYDKLISADYFTDKNLSKSDICKKLGIGIMVEDNLDYARELAGAGITTYLLDKPRNQSYDPAIDKNIIKVRSREDIDL